MKKPTNFESVTVPWKAFSRIGILLPTGLPSLPLTC